MIPPDASERKSHLELHKRGLQDRRGCQPRGLKCGDVAQDGIRVKGIVEVDDTLNTVPFKLHSLAQSDVQLIDAVASHGEGVGKPGTTALAEKYKGSKPAILNERTDLTPSITKFYVRKGVSIMPFFRKTEISDPDLEALAAYLSRTTPKSVK
jgi:hypothetical protein